MVQTKNLSIDVQASIVDIVKSDYRTAEVFKRNNINFCCSGKISLELACTERQLDIESIISDIQEATRSVFLPNNIQFNKWKTDFLLDYIVNVHHSYLYKALPEIEVVLLNFMDNHARKYPELNEIYNIYIKLSGILIKHNQDEESILFPYIRHLDASYTRNEPYGALFVRTLRKPLSNVEREHVQISQLLLELKSITNNFIFPDSACTNHQVVYHKLQELYNDLVQHKHLENNILFPRISEMEQQLLLN